MKKKGINLLLDKKPDPIALQRLKIVLPIAAVASLILFTIAFIVSYVYTQANIREYNLLQVEVSQLEQKVQERRTAEGIFTLSITLLDVLNGIVSSKVEYNPLISEVTNLSDSGITIESFSTNRKGDVNIIMYASSSANLESFVDRLIELDRDEGKFNAIYSNGVTRDQLGEYALSVSLNADSSLLQ